MAACPSPGGGSILRRIRINSIVRAGFLFVGGALLWHPSHTAAAQCLGIVSTLLGALELIGTPLGDCLIRFKTWFHAFDQPGKETNREEEQNAEKPQ